MLSIKLHLQVAQYRNTVIVVEDIDTPLYI